MNPAAQVFSGAVFVFGLIVGSFLNAVIHRLPRGIGLLHPRRSFCPQCGCSLPWHQNIPLVSWLMLRGRCASCGGRIPGRYPLVELLTALLFLTLWWSFSPALAVAYMALAALLIAGTFIDLEHMILPDILTLGGAVLGVVLSMVIPEMQPGAGWEERLRSSLFGAGVGFAVLFGVVELGKLAFGRKRQALAPEKEFEIAAAVGQAPRLRLGEDWWEVEDFFYRPSDAIRLEEAGGVVWILRPDGVERGGAMVTFAEAHGWSGRACAVVFPREAMGFGDVKFMLTLGAFLGWPGAIFSIGAGSIIGSVVGVFLLLARRLEESGRIPFGPYLAAGALVWIFGGEILLRWYLGR